MNELPDPDHMQLTQHMTRIGYEEAIERTYLGQAHIAGTGPEGTTCRHCAFWKMRSYAKQVYDPDTGAWLRERLVQPKSRDKDGLLRRHPCTRPIAGKARRRIPHDALSCRLFEENPEPPAIQIRGGSNGKA